MRRHCRLFIVCSFAYGLDDCQYRRVSKPELQVTDVSGCAVTPRAREALTAAAAAEWAVVFKALSDPVRLRLLSVVASYADREACVCDISVGIELTQPTISHHLRVLREAGLLYSDRRGSWVYYGIEPEVLHRLSEFLGSHVLATSPA